MKNIKINTSVLYGIIGFLTGIILTGSFCLLSNSHQDWNKRYYSKKMMVHKMPDGTMMNNVGMDMESQMQGMTMSLEGKSGEELEKAFVSEMIVHHQGAVEMASKILASSYSGHPEITKLAAEIMEAQTKEIEMMKGWQKSWYK